MLTALLGSSAIAKDHVWADPASITAYSLSISALVGSHQLESATNLVRFDGAGGVHKATAVLSAGFIPTGISGLALFNGPGRLLTRVAPFTTSDWIVESKDHLVADGGSTFAILHQLQKKH
jgi:hypothetical protein